MHLLQPGSEQLGDQFGEGAGEGWNYVFFVILSLVNSYRPSASEGFAIRERIQPRVAKTILEFHQPGQADRENCGGLDPQLDLLYQT